MGFHGEGGEGEVGGAWRVGVNRPWLSFLSILLSIPMYNRYKPLQPFDVLNIMLEF